MLLVRGLTRQVTDARLLGSGEPLEFDQHRGDLEQGLLRVHLPDALLDPLVTVVKLDLANS